MATLRMARISNESRLGFPLNEPDDFFHLEVQIRGEFVSKEDYHEITRHMTGIKKVFEKVTKP